LASILIFLEFPCRSVVDDFLLNKCDRNIHYYHNCVYFLVVTMTTIGYGDMIVVTTAGRIFITLTIMYYMIWFPYEINKINTFLRKETTKKDKTYLRKDNA
jgi:hypothetical protein